MSPPFSDTATTESDPITLLESAGRVFTMGRTAAVLLSDASLNRIPFRGTDTQYDVILTACAKHPDDRIQSLAELHANWTAVN